MTGSGKHTHRQWRSWAALGIGAALWLVAPAAPATAAAGPTEAHALLIEGTGLLERGVRGGDGDPARVASIATALAEDHGYPLLRERAVILAAWSGPQSADAVAAWDLLQLAAEDLPRADPEMLSRIAQTCRSLGDRWCEGLALAARADCLAQGGARPQVVADAAAAEALLRPAGPSSPLGWALLHQRRSPRPGSGEKTPVDRTAEVIELSAATGDPTLEGYALGQRARDALDAGRFDDALAARERMEEIAAAGSPRVAAYSAYVGGLSHYFRWQAPQAREIWDAFVGSETAAAAPRETLWILVAASAASNDLADWQGSIERGREAVQLVDRLQGLQDRAAAYTNLAVALVVVGRYDEASATATRCLDLARQATFPGSEETCLRVLGFARLAHDELQEGLELCQESLRIARAIGHGRDTMLSLQCVGIALVDLGRLQEGADALQESVAAADATNWAPFRAGARTRLAWQYLVEGRPEEAERAAQEALDLLGPTGNDVPRADALLNRGRARLQRQDHGGALEDFRAALDRAEASGNLDARANALIEMGNVYYFLYRLERAEAYYRRALAVANAGGSIRASAIARGNLLLLEDRAAVPDERRAEMLRRALELDEPRGPFTLNAWLNLADWLEDAGELDAADRVARRALSAAERRGAPALAVRARLVQAQVLQSRDHPAEAIEACIALLSGPGVSGSLLEISVAWECGNILVSAGERDAGIAALRRAARQGEEARASLKHAELRATFLSDRTGIYADLAHALLTGDRSPETLAEAFDISERFRAWTLLGALAAGPQPGGSEAARGELLGRIAELQLDGWSGSQPVAEEELRQLEDRLAELPGGSAPVLGTAVQGASALWADLGAPDTAHVEYLLGNLGSYAFVLDKDGLSVYALPATRLQLARQVDLYLGLLSRRSADPARDLEAISILGGSLFETLIAPFGDRLARRLVIVPDGPLHSLPFGALVNREDGGFLIERAELSFAPSLAVLAQLRRSRPAGALSFRALANPAASAEPLAPGRASGAPLPYAEEEVRNAARRLGVDGRIVSGAQATEAAARSALEEGRIVHFASHGFLDADSIGRSGVLLAPDPAVGDDGLLQAREVVDLSVAADLVVLSGCTTGGARLVPGEGLLGLPHALQQAGAPTVLMSLWEVRDRAAALFMDRFYDSLAAGRTPGEAMQAAQIDLLRSEDARLRHPSVWAPFVLTGVTDRPLIPGGGARRWGRPAFAAALLVTAALLWWLSLRAGRSRSGSGPPAIPR